MSDRAAPPTSQLLVYRFGPGAEFEGRLVGALERIESGGAMRVLDALFVSSQAETGELSAVALRGVGAGGFVAPLLGFRLDPAERRRTTDRAMKTGTKTIPAEIIRELGAALAPGCAIAALLVAHVWAEALDDRPALALTVDRPRAGIRTTASTRRPLAGEVTACSSRPGRSRRVAARCSCDHARGTSCCDRRSTPASPGLRAPSCRRAQARQHRRGARELDTRARKAWCVRIISIGRCHLRVREDRLNRQSRPTFASIISEPNPRHRSPGRGDARSAFASYGAVHGHH